MTLVQFETATFADAIRKAAKVAPTKGAALDKAAGIMIEMDPAYSDQVTIRATNLDVFYLEVVSADKVDCTEPTAWRLPAGILASITSMLPMGSQQALALEQDGSQVILKQGRTTAKLRLNDPKYYPSWMPFDPAQLAAVEDLGARVASVEWAAATRGDPPMTGVHLDGHSIIATNRYRLAMIPCEVPIVAPVTIPAGILGTVLRAKGDVQIGVAGGMFLLMPDEATQIKTVIYEADYPNLNRVFHLQYPDRIEISKLTLLEMMNRTAVMTANDRVPTIVVYVGREEFAAVCTDDEIGLLGDVLDVSGYADHPRVKFTFTPRNLTDALANAPSDKITLHYDHEDTSKPFKVDGGSGYVAVAMPRQGEK